MHKRIITIAILILMIPQTGFASFKDVPETNEYYRAVKYLEDKEVIKGFGHSTFKPETFVKKVSFLKLILKESGVEVDTDKNFITGFKDVQKNAWYIPYVKKALSLGIIKEGEKLYPEKVLRKWEALEIIFELKGIGVQKVIKENVTSKFKDIRKGSRFEGIALAAEKANIFSGTTFQPLKTITKGEVADILYKLSKKNISEVPGVTINLSNFTKNTNVSKTEKFPIFSSIWDTILNSYIEKDGLDEEELLYGAIHGMIEVLDDPYSVFQEPFESEMFQSNLEDNYEGIGIMVEMIDGKFTVITSFHNTPAEKAGIKAEDVITHVDGISISGMSSEEIIGRLKGKTGTKVKLKLKRGGKSISITVTRAKISLEAVTSEIDSNMIGVVKVSSFTYDAGNLLISHIESLVEQGARGVVIDMRSNPGGLLSSVVEMLNYYVPKNGVILSTKYGDGSMETIFSEGPGTLANLPTVVLVDNGTASASEIFAGVLQDYDIATVLGTKTFGKGTVQQILTYNDGSSFKMTVAKWLTALERDIEDTGIIPDITAIDNTSTTKDEALIKAVQQLISEL
jgi:carboxyl-terminal processing protease